MQNILGPVKATMTYLTVIHNNDPMVRVIFIKDILKHEFKIMENTYYHESRRSRHPCPQDPLEKFIWQCPVCGLEFDNM